MHEVHVRAERPSDIQAIEVVNLSAFEGDKEAQLVSELRNSAAFIPELSLVAEYKNRLVGHVMLTRIGLDGNAAQSPVLILGPMSVVPSQAYRGIGAALLRKAIEQAKAMGFSLIVEVGQTDYYLRQGFKPISQFDLKHTLGVSSDFVTAMPLQDGLVLAGKELIFPDALRRLFGLAA